MKGGERVTKSRGSEIRGTWTASRPQHLAAGTHGPFSRLQEGGQERAPRAAHAEATLGGQVLEADGEGGPRSLGRRGPGSGTGVFTRCFALTTTTLGEFIPVSQTSERGTEKARRLLTRRESAQ